MERSRRANAGNRMKELIEQQLKAGIIQVGVEESPKKEGEKIDADFVGVSAAIEEGDLVDSDFESTDEDDLIDENEFEKKVRGGFVQDDEEEKTAKKKVVNIMEIARKREKIRKLDSEGGAVGSSSQVTRKPKIRKEPVVYDGPVRTSGRSSTIASNLELKRKLEEDEFKRSLLPRKSIKKHRKYTQKELLAKAMENEKINLASLKLREFMEEEKKKKRTDFKGKQLSGPIIRYRSFKAEEKDENGQVQFVAKTLVSFHNFASDPFESWMEQPSTMFQRCPITGEKAHFRDPSSQIPYASKEVFQTLTDIMSHKYIWSPILGVFVHGYDESTSDFGEDMDGWLKTTFGVTEEEMAVWEEKNQREREAEALERERIRKEREQAKLAKQMALEQIQAGLDSQAINSPQSVPVTQAMVQVNSPVPIAPAPAVQPSIDPTENPMTN